MTLVEGKPIDPYLSNNLALQLRAFSSLYPMFCCLEKDHGEQTTSELQFNACKSILPPKVSIRRRFSKSQASPAD